MHMVLALVSCFYYKNQLNKYEHIGLPRPTKKDTERETILYYFQDKLLAHQIILQLIIILLM